MFSFNLKKGCLINHTEFFSIHHKLYWTNFNINVLFIKSDNKNQLFNKTNNLI